MSTMRQNPFPQLQRVGGWMEGTRAGKYLCPPAEALVFGFYYEVDKIYS